MGLTLVATPDRPGAPRRCDRCTAAGQRGTTTETTAPHWDPDYRMCKPCAVAVEILLTEASTLPQPDGAGGWTFSAHPAHTAAPHFLWVPDIRGLAAQVADHAAAVGRSLASGAPAAPSLRGVGLGSATGRLSASAAQGGAPVRPQRPIT